MTGPHSPFHVYILKCADGSYYVGTTSDLAARLELHVKGRGPAFTASRRPLTLVHTEPFATTAEARKREAQLKNWSREKKQALIAGDTATLQALTRRRGP